MDVQDIAQQLVSTLGSNPELLEQFGADPHGTAKEITSEHNLTASQLGTVLQIAGPLLSGGDLDLSNIDLGSLASLAAGLLGGGDDEEKTTKKKASKKSSGVDLSDGLDLGDIMGLAGGLLGGNDDEEEDEPAPKKKTTKKKSSSTSAKKTTTKKKITKVKSSKKSSNDDATAELVEGALGALGSLLGGK